MRLRLGPGSGEVLRHRRPHRAGPAARRRASSWPHCGLSSYHGGVKASDAAKANAEAVEKGFENLAKHIENVRLFGMPVVVALNTFPTDTKAEIETFTAIARQEKRPLRPERRLWQGRGGRTEALAARCSRPSGRTRPISSSFTRSRCRSAEKIETVAREIYGADRPAVKVRGAKKALERLEGDGFGRLPVCIAKTQYSLSDNARAPGPAARFHAHRDRRFAQRRARASSSPCAATS